MMIFFLCSKVKRGNLFLCNIASSVNKPIVRFPNELALLITFICPWCKLSAERER